MSKRMVHVVPFVGRNDSNCQNLNLLMSADNVYLMDNHRAALWCWLQKIKPSEGFKLLHIDAHYDLSRSEVAHGKVEALSIPSLSIQEYLDIESKYPNLESRYKMFRWDNYLSFLLEFFGKNMTEAYLSTHNLIHNPEFQGKYEEIPPVDLIDQLNNVIGRDKTPWIINVDIDYFFASSSFKQKRHQVFHEEFVDRFIELIDLTKANNQLGVLTIALSPECCRDGEDNRTGWSKSEKLAKKILNKLGYDFTLDL